MKHPDRVSRLVLNTTGGLPVTERRHSTDVERVLGAALAALENPTDEVVRTRLGHLFADPAQVPEELIFVRQAMYRRPEVSAALAKLFRLVFDPDDAARYVLSPERLALVKAPTLVVWTDHNPIFNFDDAKGHLRHIPDVRFHLVERAGHWPQYEQADDFNSAHLKFLQEN
jgi:2-hydroxy-6-oxonona-2,4-dienedioate hydrolase